MKQTGRRVARAGLALGVALLCSSLVSLAAQQAAESSRQTTQQTATAQPADVPAGAAVPAAPPASAPARITFQLDQEGAMVPRFTLAIEENGRLSYLAEQALPAGAQEGANATPATQHVEQRALLTAATTARIFALARARDRFNIGCEALEKKVADMGRKTLSYSGPGGDGSCVYNFSEVKSVATLTQLLRAIAMTLDLGRKLSFDHRFDRLGLDEDMGILLQMLADGRAVEVNAIAPTLRSIAEDGEVLERVRARATTLLQRYPPAQ
jgi:hypothetical protein